MCEKKMEWISVEEMLPENGLWVLAFYKNSLGKNRIVRAIYCAKFSIEDNGEGAEFNEDYDEEKDIYYISEGWHELPDHGDYRYEIDEKVTHWMPLPDAPK